MLYRLIPLIIVSFFVLFFEQAFAQVQYPIVELGKCASKVECKAYCDKPTNISQCLAFAKKSGLMSAREVERAGTVARALQNGPGGCADERSCKTYCGDPSHYKECVAFAKKYSLSENDEIKKIEQKLELWNKTPGGCKNANECKTYCALPAHQKKCIAFLETSGMIPHNQIKKIKENAAIIERKTPGGCANPDDCTKYCSDISHLNECLGFVEQNRDLMPNIPKINFDKTKIFKTAPMFLLKGGPGNCRSLQECIAFCQKPKNQNICLEYASATGILAPSEIEKIKKSLEEARELNASTSKIKTKNEKPRML